MTPRNASPVIAYDVAIVGIVGLPGRYGGFETLADQLVRRLSTRARILVFCSRPDAPSDAPGATETRYEGAWLEHLGWRANGWQSVPYDVQAIARARRRSRTLLVLGVSGAIALPLVRMLQPSLRVVTNIDGLEWKRRKWGPVARAFLRLSEAVAVRCSHEVIADNAAIQEHVRRAYRRDSVVIAYGGDAPLGDAHPDAAPRIARFAAGEYFLTVCRIEPENNVEEILQAFGGMPERNLVVVGNWTSPFARELRARHAGTPNLQLHDAVYDPDALGRLRREAFAYVHGHSAGGTNPSLVEAMSAGLATLAFDVEYNRHTLGGGSWFWASGEALRSLVRSLDPVRVAIEAQRARDHAERHYRWSVIAERYAQVLRLPPLAEDA